MKYTKITDVWDRLSNEQKEASEKAMKKYGSNHWWMSDDPLEVAMHQVFEDIQITDTALYQKGLEKLLDRQVYFHELGLNRNTLREEAKYAIKRLKTGIGVSDEYRETAQRIGIEILEKTCQKGSSKFIKYDL
jgi:hypothetical protein